MAAAAFLFRTMKKKRAKKPKYQLGVVYFGNEIITVKKIYPPGHRYATETIYGYLVHSTDFGEDELLEASLTRVITGTH